MERSSYQKAKDWLDNLPPDTLEETDPIPEPLMVPLYPKTSPERKFDTISPTTYSTYYREKIIDSYGGYCGYFKEKEHRDGILKKLDFVDPSDVWYTMGQGVHEGEHFRCVAGYVLSPRRFYLNPLSSWNYLEKLMEEMQKDYDDLDSPRFKHNPATPWKGHLYPGVLIMAKCRKPEEYHRAMIIKVNEKDENFYEVRLMDYGDLELVHIKNLRYMRRKYLQKLHFQGILCRLHLDREIPWEDNLDGKILRQLVFDKDLIVKFVKKQVDKDYGTILWDVFLHATVTENHEKVTQFHVERKLLRITRRGKEVDPEKIETDTEETLKITKFFCREMGNLRL